LPRAGKKLTLLTSAPSILRATLKHKITRIPARLRVALSVLCCSHDSETFISVLAAGRLLDQRSLFSFFCFFTVVEDATFATLVCRATIFAFHQHDRVQMLFLHLVHLQQ
jgi:hypothetical protein